ncbi:SWPV1-301 [Shearwaterpox virus]|uniref:SWPV1-301 n=1 Tax=Shearwaterpox virus TaxID=1974596 RepID=A0A1V0S8B0_CNPV|nr:SWPV1-301 [Shearwaterpox virus]
MAMALNFETRPIGQELATKVLTTALDPLNSLAKRDGNNSFVIQLIRNVKFQSPRYLCAAEGDTVKIYFLEGKGGLIFSVSDVSSSSKEEESGYLTEGNYVEFEAKFSCLITLACTSPSNSIVFLLE